VGRGHGDWLISTQKLQTFQFGLIRREKLLLTTDYGITDTNALLLRVFQNYSNFSDVSK